MAVIVAVLSTLAGAGASLMMVVLLLASAPNSKPEQWMQIKMLMLAVAIMGFLGLVGAVWAMCVDRPWLASAAGIMPAGVVIVMLAVLLGMS
jgi:hypothetical protein